MGDFFWKIKLYSIIASASISTKYPFPTSFASTNVFAGLIFENLSPCAIATFSQSSILFTKILVLTISFNSAPNELIAASILSMIKWVWADGSLTPTTLFLWVAVVPETYMVFPILLALE